jgi:putative nucleotidyltransferase with HDIG domain/PAS domain S-box-containing protein
MTSMYREFMKTRESILAAMPLPVPKGEGKGGTLTNPETCDPWEEGGILSSVFVSIQDGMSIMDLDFNIIQVNPSMEKWYPHAMPLLGRKCFQAYQGLSMPCRPCPAHRAIITGRPHSETVARRGVTGNTLGWLEVYSFPWRDNQEGKIIGVINYLRDITYRLQIEEEKQDSLIKVQKTLDGTVTALASLSEQRDPYTAGHQQRVAQLACAIAREMKLDQKVVDGLQVIGCLHDIGKITIPSELLCKPCKLNEYELNIIKIHPQNAFDILKEIEFPWPVAKAVFQHHERLNGSGYPLGSSNNDIILEARILAVADVTEAINSHRPYRPALGLEKALEEISRNSGFLYDRNIVDACLTLFKKRSFNFE